MVGVGDNMAYTEKLLPVEALLGMWQQRRQQETQDTSGMQEREKLQNELLRKQIERADWNMLKEKSPDTMTVKSGSGVMAGEPGFTEKRFLSDVPGYISGTPGAQVFAEKMATGRAAMQAMANSGSTAQPQNEELNNATVDIANEQAKKLRMENQGYGSSIAERLAQQRMESQLAGDVAKANATVDAAEIKAQDTAAQKAQSANITNQKKAQSQKKEKQNNMGGLWDNIYKDMNFPIIKDNPQLLKELEDKLPKLYDYSIQRNRPLNITMVLENLIRDKRL